MVGLISVWALLSLSGPGSDPPPAAQPPAAARARIMVVGVYHLDRPGLDLVNPTVRDVLVEERQREIAAVIEGLAGFAPTHIAIEQTLEQTEVLKQQYQAFCAGQLRSSRSEVHQLGFRLAMRMKHEQVWPVDHRTDMDMGPTMRLAPRVGQKEFVEAQMAKAQRVGEYIESVDRACTLGEALAVMNQPRLLEQSHGFYVDLLRVNRADRYPAAELLEKWYGRNVRIFCNLRRLAEEPGDRVLLFIGQGHVPIIRTLIMQSSDLEWVEPLQYLPKPPAEALARCPLP